MTGPFPQQLFAMQTRSLSLADVVPVLIGAVIALVGTIVVQLLIVPWADTRKRREQRWEEDLLALGRLLTFDQPAIVEELQSELTAHVLVIAPPKDVDTTTARFQSFRQEHEEKLRSAREAFDNLRARVDWLIDRVVSLAPRAKALQNLVVQQRTYYLRHVELDMIAYKPIKNGDAVPTADDVFEAADSLAKITKEMVESVKKMAAGGPPRNPLSLPKLKRLRGSNKPNNSDL